MRVLGIDPGLTRCGLGVVEGAVGRPLRMVEVGVVRTQPDLPVAERLRLVDAGIEAWLDRHAPDGVAVERVFSQHNVRTVMGTAQVGGLALVAAARRGIPVALHTPSEVKAAVTGSGRADKEQVGGDGHPAAAAAERAQPRRRRGRAGAGDLPHLAGRCAGPLQEAAAVAARPPRSQLGGERRDRLRARHRRPGRADRRWSSTSGAWAWS